MGGAKVVYEHAAGLAALGHEVTVVAPRQQGTGLREHALRVAVAVRDRLHGVAGDVAYEVADVSTVEIPRPEPRFFPDADVVIATGVQTTSWVAALPPKKGKRFYFVQGDERFVTPDARKTWHLGLEILTCAGWLAREIEAAGRAVRAVIPNAIDPREFGLDEPVSGRAPRVVALYHRHPVKGPDVLIEALTRVLREWPHTTAAVFCARPPSHRLPTEVEVHVRPDPLALRRLYNSAAVLLHPSRSEGWPLVPMEAAACGCAVVACANPGVQEYLRDGETMRAVPVGDGAALGRATLDVLANPDERVRLAEAARTRVGAMSWAESTARLARALSSP